MSKRTWRDLFILLSVFAILWLVFAVLPIFPDKDDFLVSTEKEQIIGEQMVDNLLYNAPGVKLIDDYKVNAFVDSVFTVLHKNMEPSQYAYTLYVVKNEQVNAFAMPGAYIVIYSGLIEFCDSPEELAAIIAHEIGHIEKRHVINRLVKKLGLAVLLSGDPTVVSEVSELALSTVFDRKQEREADAFAHELLAKSGISPRIVSKLFRKLEKEGMTYHKNMEILMTHPHNDQRIKAALSYPLDSTFVEHKLDFDLNTVKERL